MPCGLAHGEGKTVETILSGLLNKRFKSSGIRIKRQKGAIEFDVAVVLEYGVNIPIITWMIQNNVRRAILEEFEEKVVAVNILVDDIDYHMAGKAEILYEVKAQRGNKLRCKR